MSKSNWSACREFREFVAVAAAAVMCWSAPALADAIPGAAGSVMVSDGVLWRRSILPDCDSGTSKLLFSLSTRTFTCGADAGAASSAPLSSLLAAIATNSINNLAYAQTWSWSLTGGETAMTLTDTAGNGGTVLRVSDAGSGSDTLLSLTSSTVNYGAGLSLYDSRQTKPIYIDDATAMTAAGGVTGRSYALFSRRKYATSTGTNPDMYGIWNEVKTDTDDTHASTVRKVVGDETTVTLQDDYATLTGWYGDKINMDATSKNVGTVTTAYGAYIGLVGATSPGVVTSAYGVYVAPMTGNITNAFSAYFGDRVLLGARLEDNDDLELRMDANNDGANKLTVVNGTGTEVGNLDENGNMTLSNATGGQGLYFNMTNDYTTGYILTGGHVDGGDTTAICITGSGGCNNPNRGAYIYLYGNESFFIGGDLVLATGNHAISELFVNIAGSTVLYGDTSLYLKYNRVVTATVGGDCDVAGEKNRMVIVDAAGVGQDKWCVCVDNNGTAAWKCANLS